MNIFDGQDRSVIWKDQTLVFSRTILGYVKTLSKTLHSRILL